MSVDRTDHTVYVVAWDEAGIIKAGSSHRQRWLAFVDRGARVVSLRTFPDVTSCYKAENATHGRLRRIFPHAFRGKGEAKPYLGGCGDGWAECYRVAPATVSQPTTATVSQLTTRTLQ